MAKEKHPSKQKKGMKIVIVGCGKVGQTLVEQLSKEGHDITIIDQNAARLSEVANVYDVMGIIGNGASSSVQRDAGMKNADLVIAVTDSDELNLLCCTIAKRIGDCAAIARVRTPDYSDEAGFLKEQLGLALIINPEAEAANVTSRILALPTTLDANAFAHEHASLIRFKIPEENMLDGMTLAEFGKTMQLEVLICAIERDGDVHIPSGDFELRSGDIISVVSSKKTIKPLLQGIGFKTKHVKNCMIVGGGDSALYLTRQLLHMGVDVKIIERNPKRCEELSLMLPKAIIINGDGTDHDLLKEEGITYTEAFVPLTGIDEENVMLTLYAKQVSKAKVVTKINRTAFKDVISDLDLGSIIYPRYITSEAIIAYVRARTASMDSNIETLYHMFDNRVEAIEFRIQEDSPVTNKTLQDLSLKKDLLLACIVRNGKIIIPSGQDEIKVGDSIMVVTTHSGLSDVRDILK